MTRARQQISLLLTIASVYLTLRLGFIPLPPTLEEEILPVLPYWALISLGAYLLFKLGWGVFSFNDCPEAHKELMKQIKTAKEDLKAKGVSVD